VISMYVSSVKTQRPNTDVYVESGRDCVPVLKPEASRL
jgi:hypothetical protein